jgi:hypothetical protein
MEFRFCLEKNIFRITEFSDFVHLPVLQELENTTFRKLDLFPASGDGGGVKPVLSGHLEITRESAKTIFVYSLKKFLIFS